jgi:hypothetical protein
MTENEYLSRLLDNQKLSEYNLQWVRSVREQTENFLRNIYGSHISNFYYSGSIWKWTAINEDFDIDLCVYFREDSFNTLSDMFNSVYNALGSGHVVRKQRVSIGLVSMNVDVVPWRKLNEDGDINLYDSKAGTFRKTNIPLHKSYISEYGDREVIKLLKLWKIRQKIDMKSFAMEILSIRALNWSSPSGLANKLRTVWKYIENTNLDSLILTDPANSNNNLMDSIDNEQKRLLKNKSSEALKLPYWENIIW